MYYEVMICDLDLKWCIRGMYNIVRVFLCLEVREYYTESILKRTDDFSPWNSTVIF
jgi:hypothetical protein